MVKSRVRARFAATSSRSVEKCNFWMCFQAWGEGGRGGEVQGQIQSQIRCHFCTEVWKKLDFGCVFKLGGRREEVKSRARARGRTAATCPPKFEKDILWMCFLT